MVGSEFTANGKAVGSGFFSTPSFQSGEGWTCESLSRVWPCDPTDCSPPGCLVHGVLQARILEWVAIPFPKGWGSPTLQADSSPSEPPGKPPQPGKQRPNVLSHVSVPRPSLYHSRTRPLHRCILNVFPDTWLSDLHMVTLWGFCQFSEKVRTGLGLTTMRDSVKSTLQITNDKFTILLSIWPSYYYFPYLFLIGRNLTGNYS